MEIITLLLAIVALLVAIVALLFAAKKSTVKETIINKKVSKPEDNTEIPKDVYLDEEKGKDTVSEDNLEIVEHQSNLKSKKIK